MGLYRHPSPHICVEFSKRRPGLDSGKLTASSSCSEWLIGLYVHVCAQKGGWLVDRAAKDGWKRGASFEAEKFPR